MTKVVALAGGVGGARMAQGFAQLLPADELTVIVNVGDDFEHLGLTICPDLDTVMYTLAGIVNEETGWGIAGDTFGCLERLSAMGASGWFRVGDRDLATHLARTRWLWEGGTLTETTARIARSLGVQQSILPATDDIFRTIIDTDEGELEFQEYFVRRSCKPLVRGISFRGQNAALPSRAALHAVETSDLIVFCPSNPFVSLAPILALPGLAECIGKKLAVAVSPLIGGKAVKGPAAKMFAEFGRPPTVVEVAKEYQKLIQGIVLDSRDTDQIQPVEALNIRTHATDILMPDLASRKRLAETVLRFGLELAAA